MILSNFVFLSSPWVFKEEIKPDKNHIYYWVYLVISVLLWV